MFDFMLWQDGDDDEAPESLCSLERLAWVRGLAGAGAGADAGADTPPSPAMSLTRDRNRARSGERGSSSSQPPAQAGAVEMSRDARPGMETEMGVGLAQTEPRARKGHKKSRRGCFNCKRKKIKCQENRPACTNCVKTRAACGYPSEQKPRVEVVYAVQDPVDCLVGSSRLQSTPTIFTASDMRLFHHFIMTAYPHLPLGNGDVWVREIPAFAHSYDFLLQGMLALAASHLTMTTTSNLSHPALTYRVLAIGNLNLALSRGPSSSEESDAILATCFALAFQTSYIGESIEEFLTLLRGCVLVYTQEWRRRFRTRFIDWDILGNEEFLSKRLKGLDLLDGVLVAEAADALRKIEHVAREGGEVVREVWRYLLETVELCCVDCHAAYMRNRDLRIYFSNLSTASFTSFISPTNAPAQLILAHFIAVSTLMAPIKAIEFAGRTMPPANPNRRTMFFMTPILERIPQQWVGEGLMEYPLRATGSVDGVPGLLERLLGEKWCKRSMLDGGKIEPSGERAKGGTGGNWEARVHEGAEEFLELAGLGRRDEGSEDIRLGMAPAGKAEGLSSDKEDWDGAAAHF